eukprot:scaffold1228_cov119-Cylindrotheca_fusiformis.AAC.17
MSEAWGKTRVSSWSFIKYSPVVPISGQYFDSPVVKYIHQAPRFGHSNRVGTLLSSTENMDYAQGLKQFTLFVVIPFIFWGLILLAFKFLYGKARVGCAAGGQIVDIRTLSKQGVPRKTRKQYIVRNWRVQTTFQIVAVMIPCLTILLMKSPSAGWRHMDTAVQEVQDTLDDMESWSYRGQRIVNGLQRTKQQLEEHVFIQEAIAAETDNASVFDRWCPHSNNNDESSMTYMRDAFLQVQQYAATMLENDEFTRYVPEHTNGFDSVLSVTTQIQDALQWFLDHKWVFKMLLMLLNVVNLLLLLVSYLFSKNNIIHEPTRVFTSWLLLPSFCVLTAIVMGVTAMTGVAALFNADFCSGGASGEQGGSPQGTFHDAILSLEFGTVAADDSDMDRAVKLVYDSFVYYSNGCLTDHPLAFLEEFGKRIDEGVVYMSQLSGALEDAQDETFVMDKLNQECGADASYLPETIGSLEGLLQTLQEQMHSFVKLTSCSQVSPIIRRVTHGAICDESAMGFTWIWATCFSLLVCCFTLLTVRAALFNSIKKGKSREKKPRRIVEKEFDEYKEYMAEYYGDDEVAKWVLDGETKKAPKKKVDHVEFEFGSPFLQRNPTFGTESTSPESAQAGVFKFDDSNDIEEDSKPRAVVRVDLPGADDQSSDGSSYESCSDDSDSDDDDDSHNDNKSALYSFMVETKSMVRQSLENAKELGSVIGDNISVIGSSVSAAGSVFGGSMLSGRSDDRSVISSFSSKASSLARQAADRVSKLKPLLGLGGGGIDQEDSASIDDDSLFLPDEPVVVQEKTTSTSQALPKVDSVSAHPDVDEISFRPRSRRTTQAGRNSLASATTAQSSTSAGHFVDGIRSLITPTSN